LEPLSVVLVLLVATGLSVVGVRHARARGLLRTRQSTCAGCGTRGPVMEVRYHQNTGMLFMRQSQSYIGLVCRRCSSDVFVRMTLHNLVLGWWGMISMVLTPLFIANNLGFFVASLTLPGRGLVAARALEDQREYALNLLATKGEATVIQVLCGATGASEADVVSYLRRLRVSA
jgi:hypothetical protein